MTPEGEIKRSICEWLLAKRIMFWLHIAQKMKRKSKFVKPGLPDIGGIYRGRPLAIEVKTPEGKVSPEQEKFIEEFRREGGIAFTAKSVEEVEKKLMEVG